MEPIVGLHACSFQDHEKGQSLFDSSSFQMGHKQSKTSKSQKKIGDELIQEHYEEEGIDYCLNIEDQSTWNQFKHNPTDRSFSHTSVIKVVIPYSERVSSSRGDCYFLQSEKWVFHWNFTRDVLRDPTSQDLVSFNALNYTDSKRDFILLTITKYEDQGMYSFELAARDNLPFEDIHRVYELLKSHVYFGDKLYYRPISKMHESNVAGQDKTKVPIIESDKLFGGVKYQPLTIGLAYGYLKLVHEKSEEEDVNNAKWNDILLCESIPNELPVISGLVTSVLQTPLCHVALLCGNRGTPNCASVGSFEKDELIKLVGKPIKMQVGSADLDIQECSEQEVTTWQNRRFEKLRGGGANIQLKADIGQTQIIQFSKFLESNGSDSASPNASSDKESLELQKLCIGAKALNCLALAQKKVGSNLLSNAFVIPYFYYHTMIRKLFYDNNHSSNGNHNSEISKENGTALESDEHIMSIDSPDNSKRNEIQELLNDAKSNDTPDARDYAQRCQKIREQILCGEWTDPFASSPSPNGTKHDQIDHPTLIEMITSEIERWKSLGLWNRCDGIIFRSSTNAEDIEGFNAAGLYESIPLEKEHCTDSSKIIEVVKKVWASVWNFKGFEERRLFGLDSSQVQMAILCQPWFHHKQRCNGVAVTAHPFRHDFPGHLINLQKAGFLVTDSCGGARPEQHVIWIYNRTTSVIETLCLSSLMNEALMSEQEIQELIPMLNYLDKEFGHNTPGTKSNIVQGTKKTKFCVDVEFLVMQDTGEIVILQCRPYKMVYEYDLKRNK